MHLIRTSILLGLLSTAACDAQDYQGEYTPDNVRPYAVQPYAVQPIMPGYPIYQEPGYAVPDDVTPFAHDDRLVPRGGNYYGDFGRGYGLVNGKSAASKMSVVSSAKTNASSNARRSSARNSTTVMSATCRHNITRASWASSSSSIKVGSPETSSTTAITSSSTT